MEVVTRKTCSGLETWVWVEGGLVRAQDALPLMVVETSKMWIERFFQESPTYLRIKARR